MHKIFNQKFAKMSLTKKFLKSKPVCKVTFKVDADTANGAKKVFLAGDFNEWKTGKKAEMKKLKNGSFTTTVDLETGKEHAFRYVVDGKQWINESEADKYVPSGVSYEENSVVVL